MADCEIGGSESPLDNPPELGEGDLMAWRFYQNSATGFVQDFGLMSHLIEGLGIGEKVKPLFLRKLALVHSSMQNIREKEMRVKNVRR